MRGNEDDVCSHFCYKFIPTFLLADRFCSCLLCMRVTDVLISYACVGVKTMFVRTFATNSSQPSNWLIFSVLAYCACAVQMFSSVTHAGEWRRCLFSLAKNVSITSYWLIGSVFAYCACVIQMFSSLTHAWEWRLCLFSLATNVSLTSYWLIVSVRAYCACVLQMFSSVTRAWE